MKKIFLLIILILSTFFVKVNAQWHEINNGISNLHLNAIGINGNDIYTGSIDGEIYHTTDSGSNWQIINSGYNMKLVMGFAFIDGDIYVGTYSAGLYKSSNDGKEWQQVISSMYNYGIYSIVNKDSLIFVASDIGLFISSDKGDTWYVNKNDLTDKSFFSVIFAKSFIFFNYYK